MVAVARAVGIAVGPSAVAEAAPSPTMACCGSCVCAPPLKEGPRALAARGASQLDLQSQDPSLRGPHPQLHPQLAGQTRRHHCARRRARLRRGSPTRGATPGTPARTARRSCAGGAPLAPRAAAARQNSVAMAAPPHDAWPPAAAARQQMPQRAWRPRGPPLRRDQAARPANCWRHHAAPSQAPCSR
jgi:hypothetical protein